MGQRRIKVAIYVYGHLIPREKAWIDTLAAFMPHSFSRAISVSCRCWDFLPFLNPLF